MCNTVGELVEKLKEFDPAMPLDIAAFAYTGSDRDHWVEIRRDIYGKPGYDNPCPICVEAYSYGGKDLCRLSPDSDYMEFRD